jgi:hypothetical protein
VAGFYECGKETLISLKEIFKLPFQLSELLLFRRLKNIYTCVTMCVRVYMCVKQLADAVTYSSFSKVPNFRHLAFLG